MIKECLHLCLNHIINFKIQIQNTPNPNSLKFIPGKKVSEVGPLEILDPKDTKIQIIKNLLSIKGVRGLFLYEDFLSINKNDDTEWTDIKHIVTSYLNEYYSSGNDSIVKISNNNEENQNLTEIEKKIIHILETKIRPAVSRDGGDITLNGYKDGVVTVKLKGSCSGCPSSTITLKKGVENLLTHYIPEIKEVKSI